MSHGKDPELGDPLFQVLERCKICRLHGQWQSLPGEARCSEARAANVAQSRKAARPDSINKAAKVPKAYVLQEDPMFVLSGELSAAVCHTLNSHQCSDARYRISEVSTSVLSWRSLSGPITE